MSNLSVRQVADDDRPAEEYLRRSGMTTPPARRYEGTYVGAFRDDELVGVVGHFWNGMLLVQADGGVGQAASDPSVLAIRASGITIRVARATAALSPVSPAGLSALDAHLLRVEVADE